MKTATQDAARYNDLDAVRALALILGVALHGMMSFMIPRVWIVDDSHHDIGFDIAFFTIHMFRMATFFVLAGFFARMMMQKRGVGGFIANRAKRIALPLVVFWPLVLAAIIAMMIIANAPTPGGAPSGAPAVAPPPQPALSAQTFPLTHLWFLYVLLLLYAGAIVLKLATDMLHIGGLLGRGIDAITGVLVRWDMMPLLLALPLGLALYSNPAWVMWFGVTTPDTGLIPNPLAISAFVPAFAFGWFLNRGPDLIDHLAQRWWQNGSCAIVMTAICLKLAGTQPQLAPVAGHDHVLYICAYTLGVWTWVLALIGAGRRFLSRHNPATRYLADASYWVYIVHVPVLLVLQNAVKAQDWPTEAKFAVVLFGTLATALLSYQLLVRYSFIGTILNGRRRAKNRTPAPLQEDFA